MLGDKVGAKPRPEAPRSVNITNATQDCQERIKLSPAHREVLPTRPLDEHVPCAYREELGLDG